MIALDGLKEETFGILGLARSGLSAARALLAGGAHVFAWDDKEVARSSAPEGVTLEDWQRWPWQKLKAVVLSPGIPLTHPAPHPIVARAHEAGASVIGDIDLFARAIAGPRETPMIAVTGTNGKSTTTALIGHVLQSCGFDAQVGGNIGKPALDLAPPGPKTIYVLEVSSYQIELAPHLSPNVSVLTNLSPDHVDRHGTMENYVRIKASLLAHTAPRGHAVVGTDDPYSAAIYTQLASANGAETVAVSIGKVLGRGVFVIDGVLYDAWSQPAEQVGDLNTAPHLPGAHNWQNAALAYAAVRPFVRNPREIMDAIERFPGLAHRIENVGEIGKVCFYNDSKATNAEATARALACFGEIFWIAGGKPKEGGIAGLEPYFPHIRGAYLIGEAAAEFGKALEGKLPVRQCGTLERALNAAYADAFASNAGAPVVLLSPACASFDQFRDFEHRGDAFRHAVKALVDGSGMPLEAQA